MNPRSGSRGNRGARAVSFLDLDMGWASTSLPPHPLFLGWGRGAYTRNLADSDSEAIRLEEFCCGHGHAPLLCLPPVFLDLLREGPGSAQATAPQMHTERPTQRDTSGTPGSRGTTSQHPRDPHRVSERDHTTVTQTPGLAPAGKDHSARARGRLGGQTGRANPVSPSSSHHSPLTWYLRSKAWFFFRRATILRSSSASFSSCLLMGDSAL